MDVAVESIRPIESVAARIVTVVCSITFYAHLAANKEIANPVRLALLRFVPSAPIIESIGTFKAILRIVIICQPQRVALAILAGTINRDAVDVTD